MINIHKYNRNKFNLIKSRSRYMKNTSAHIMIKHIMINN
uniref:50S ribosomal protein L32 n=1 Tax=Vanilla shenzhenica TaxID=1088844 RepID=A0A6B9MQU4_9ASPA|nr:50S ribosomal protein L32 [Vanilla shenzhenica]